MSNVKVISLSLLLFGCGPDIAAGTDDDAGSSGGPDATSTGMDPSMTTTTTTTSSSADSTGGAPGTTTDAPSSDTTATSDAPEETGSTGEPWTHVAEQTRVDLQCPMDVPTLWIEIHPDDDDGSCATPDDIDASAILFLSVPWDGLAGTFVSSPDGPAAANWGSDLYSGPITVEVSEPWAPASVTWELEGPEGPLSGSAELSGCFDDEPAPPCE